MLEIWTHGVGSSCNGNEFHHSIRHIVDIRIARTLCGVDVPTKKPTWWREQWQGRLVFDGYRDTSKKRWDNLYDCQRCAKLQR